MIASDTLIWLGAFLSILAIGLLRFSWGRQQCSTLRNGVAWALLLAGLILGALAYGAWGVSVAGLAATAAALALLIPGALAAQADTRRTPDRRALPARPALRLGRRLLTFVLTIPAGLLAAVLLAIAVHALANLAGWHPADSVALALMLLPILWALLASAILMARQP